MSRRTGLILWLPLAAIACASALTANQVAQLRGGVRPDSIDVLIAQAVADTGEYREVGDMAYGFTGSYRALNALSQRPPQTCGVYGLGSKSACNMGW
jgi:hypothetical protein